MKKLFNYFRIVSALHSFYTCLQTTPSQTLCNWTKCCIHINIHFQYTHRQREMICCTSVREICCLRPAKALRYRFSVWRKPVKSVCRFSLASFSSGIHGGMLCRLICTVRVRSTSMLYVSKQTPSKAVWNDTHTLLPCLLSAKLYPA